MKKIAAIQCKRRKTLIPKQGEGIFLCLASPAVCSRKDPNYPLNDVQLSSSSSTFLLSELFLMASTMLSWKLQSKTNGQLGGEESQGGLQILVLFGCFGAHPSALIWAVLKCRGGNPHVLRLADIPQGKGCYGEKDWTSLHQEEDLLKGRKD